jgi:hypothetical protein
MAEATTARERPLTLRAAEVRAVLDGRKTQSRVVARIAENGGLRLTGPYVAFARDSIGLVWRPYGGAPEQPMPPEKVSECSPVGQVGDRLWVKEIWALVKPWHDPDSGYVEDFEEWSGPLPKEKPDGWAVVYRSDWDSSYDHPDDRLFRWRPSITMPRWASRLTLEITEVRVERLADISEEDAVAEGSPRWIVDLDGRAYDLAEKDWIRWSRRLDPDAGEATARGVFAAQWERTNGRKPGRAWADSPWVWAITFRRVDSC